MQKEEPLETEKKYKIEKFSEEDLKNMSFSHVYNIVQTYLKPTAENMRFAGIATKNAQDILKKNPEIRTRKRVEKGNAEYFITLKYPTEENATRAEYETPLSPAEYEKILSESEIIGRLEKTRYCLENNGHTFEIDEYPFWDDFAIMEVELGSSHEDYDIPECIHIIEDVTNNEAYKNKNIINHQSSFNAH